MKKLLTKLARHDIKRELIVQEIKEFRANLEFPCGCGKQHKIKDCDVIQTHWYTSPYGCSDGDYWNEGELQIVCPDTGHRNRVLSAMDDITDQFKWLFKPLFKSVTDNYREDLAGGHWNNFFVKENVEYYGLEVKK